ncbi:MAG: recombinase family protein, partial [Altererythrobacter sp.]|nr:recombinase family protein [Altererythrobacter sp.]
SGLGLEAQREAVLSLCHSRGWEMIAEHTEVESGKIADRPELTAALQSNHCNPHSVPPFRTK